MTTSWESLSDFQASINKGVDKLSASTGLQFTIQDLYQDGAIELDEEKRIKVILFVKTMQG